MSSLSSVEAKLPPGFRFHPRDEELICDYLINWVAGRTHALPLLVEVDINKCEPWDIPEVACVGGKQWYFYCQRDRKYATGIRKNRATVSGYWKATGKDRPIIRNRILVGMRKTLVFYQGRAPKGRKTDWVMHEFRQEGTRGPNQKPVSPVKEDWVLCRVFFKSRTETPEKSQETSNLSNEAPPSSPTLPPLTDPLMAFDPTAQSGPSGHHYHEQVPCFSMFNNSSPTFSLLAQMAPPETMPNFGGMIPDLGYHPQLLMDNDNEPTMMRAVMRNLAKMKRANDQISIKGGSPSFGEGRSDSYLSEVGLSCTWNQY